MLSNYLTLCRPLLLLPSIFPSIRIFFNELALHIGGQSIGASASASVLPMNIQGWFPFRLTGLISFAVQGTLKRLLQHHNLKASILCNSKVHIVKVMVFPVVMYGCEGWTIKKAERQRRTDAEAPILWPPDVKSWLIRKDPDAGKDWRQEEKGTPEDEMVGWHHWLNGHVEQAPGDVKDREAWRATFHGVAKTQLSDWTTATQSRSLT